MKTREKTNYEAHGARIYIYENVAVGVTYSATVHKDGKRLSKDRFRWSKTAKAWAEKEARKL